MVILFIIILIVALAAAVAYGLSLRRDVRNVTEQLASMRQGKVGAWGVQTDAQPLTQPATQPATQPDNRPITNVQLRTRTFYRQITALETSLNELLDEQRRESLGRRRAEAAMRQALTNISHDLRTPLTSARGYLQLAEAPETGEAQRAEYLRTVGERLDALTTLIDRLFAFTQIVEGRDIELERLDVAAVLRGALASRYEELERAGLAVEVSCPEAPLMTIADAEALARIFSNLVTNAALHGERYLAVGLDADAHSVTFTNPVSPGGAASIDVEHLFERFYTADASRSRHSAGLGLAIVRTLAERMGMRVSATLEGDLFEVRLVLTKR